MKLSIAIPAYNAERFLERMVRSLLNQTLKDLEVLIANDGSKDGTLALAQKLAREDPRVRVFDIHPNAGAYGARLRAWKEARGEYITAVDADDWVEPNMYERMIELADREKLDVVQCDVFGAAEADGRVETLTGEEVYQRVVYPTLVDCGEGAYVWNKIYRNVYDFSTWVTGGFGSYEDLIHNLQLFRSVKRMAFLHEGFYHYEVTPSSVTRNFNVRGLEVFKEVASVKRQLVGAYGIAPNAPVLDKWEANDLRNAMITASIAPAVDWKTKVGNVRAVMCMDKFPWKWMLACPAIVAFFIDKAWHLRAKLMGERVSCASR